MKLHSCAPLFWSLLNSRMYERIFFQDRLPEFQQEFDRGAGPSVLEGKHAQFIFACCFLLTWLCLQLGLPFLVCMSIDEP